MAIITDVPTGILPPAAPPTSGPTSPAAGTGVSGSAPGRRGEHSLFGADGLTFHDLLDMVNPLQHLPVVSHVYRALTDDDLSPGARMVGGGVFGGFIGLGVAMFNTVLEEVTGKDLGEHVIAFFTGSDEYEGAPGALPPEMPQPTQYAAATVSPPGPAPSPTSASTSRSPLAEPVPLVPQPIPAVHRESLPSPRPLATATSAAVQPDPTSEALDARPRPIPRRPQARALSLNTELMNILMYSVPIEVGGQQVIGDRGAGNPGPQPSAEDLSSLLDQVASPSNLAALASGYRAYASGQATRVAAVAGGVFTPLAPEDAL
jgi:hypothetical protein